MGTDKSTVGIIGGGFAGVACAKRLAGKPDAQVTLSDGSAILTRLCVWGGGLQAADVVAAPGLPRGRGERIDVEPELTVARKATSPPCRNSGSVAQQAGRWAAGNMGADLKVFTAWAEEFYLRPRIDWGESS